MTISLPRDANRINVIGGTSSVDGVSPVAIYVDPTTHRLLVDLSGAAVTSISVASANGLAGTSSGGTTPILTLSTTVNGIVKGNGTALSAATDGTDYLSSSTGVKLDQTVGQTIGATGARLTKLWATDITVTNAITGSITGNAGTVTNGVYTTDVTTTSTASKILQRDSNANAFANNFLSAYTTTATAAGTTTLTVASTQNQFFTGTTTQTVVLPDATTLALGFQFYIHNNSTGLVTVNANGGATVWILGANSEAIFTCTNISTAAGVWDTQYRGTGIASGKKLSFANSLLFSGTDGSSVAFGTGGTVLYSGGALGTPSSGVLTNCTGLPEGGLSLTDITTNDVSTTKHGFTPKAPNDTTKFLRGDATWAVPVSGASYWTTVPGTPTRVSNTQFTITDTGNANSYDSLLSAGTVLKWTDTTTKQAVVTSATYATNTVTINIMGDILTATATMNTMKYALTKARVISFSIPGTIATGTDLAGRFYCDRAYHIFGAYGYHTTAGTTNATTYDVNKNGTTVFTTKISIASGATSSGAYTADSGTTTAQGDYISIDCDTVSTTAPVDAWITLIVASDKDTFLT